MLLDKPILGFEFGEDSFSQSKSTLQSPSSIPALLAPNAYGGTIVRTIANGARTDVFVGTYPRLTLLPPLPSIRVKPMAKITGIGGVFFKAKSNPKELAAWYEKHLGLTLSPWGGAALKWPEDKANDGGVTAWHIAAPDSKWFSPSESSFMINYRIDNMDEMLEQLKAGGVEIVKGPESHENGRFAWIVDPDGNKVELWQPMAWDEKNKQG